MADYINKFQEFVNSLDVAKYHPLDGMAHLSDHMRDWILCYYGDRVQEAIDSGWTILMFKNLPGVTNREKKLIAMTRERGEEAYTVQSLVHELSHALDPIWNYKSLATVEDWNLLYQEEYKAYSAGFECLLKMPKSFYKKSFYTKQHVRNIKKHGIDKSALMSATLDICNRLQEAHNKPLLYRGDVRYLKRHTKPEFLAVTIENLDQLQTELKNIGIIIQV